MGIGRQWRIPDKWGMTMGGGVEKKNGKYRNTMHGQTMGNER